MSQRVDLYNSTYGNFDAEVLAQIRRDTYGEDIGQNSWITTDEYDNFFSWLELAPRDHVLEVASGSGGPALYLTRKFDCRITGIDNNEEGLNTARQSALRLGITTAEFKLVDVNQGLPCEDETFDAIMCIDSINHFQNRLAVLHEWHRVLKPKRRILFTDPVVLTGPVSNAELASRSNIGFFLFVPIQITEQLIRQAGFNLLRREDVTENIALTSGRWHSSRQQHQKDLLRIEGEARYKGLQEFATVVHRLTSERRLSRFVFLAEKVST